MKLILTEKASVARNYVEALGGDPKEDFYSGYYLCGDYVIVNSVGHLFRLFQPEDYSQTMKSWDIRPLPIIPKEFKIKSNGTSSTEKQINIIKKAFNANPIDEIILATDADREGELIGREIIEELGFLEKAGLTFTRIWSSKTMTDSIIQEELRGRKPLSDFDDLAYQAKIRARMDWLNGINYTRLLTKVFNDLCTFGRVQSCLLNILYKRDQEIALFQDFCFYVNSFDSIGLTFTFSSDFQEDRTKTEEERKEEAQRIQELVENKREKVIRVSEEIKEELPPPLFDLNELSKQASKIFKYTAKETLDIAQSLYEKHKVLTYPRTESRFLSKKNYDYFCSSLIALGLNNQGVSLDHQWIFNPEEVKDEDKAHHALFLTAPKTAEMSEAENNLYDLIFCSMQQVLSSPHIYKEISSSIEIAEDVVFRNKRKEILSSGWKDFIYQRKDREEKSSLIEKIEDGSLVQITNNRIERKKKNPPTPYKEWELLSVMKRFRLGTSATQGKIMEDIISDRRGYASRDKGKFVLLHKGKIFIQNIYKNEILKDYIEEEYTGIFEEQLETSPETMKDEFKENFFKVKNYFVEHQEEFNLKSLKEYFEVATCCFCGGAIYEGAKNYFCKTKDCFSVGKMIAEAPISKEDIIQLSKSEMTEYKKMISSRTGKKFRARLSLDPETKKIIFNF